MILVLNKIYKSIKNEIIYKLGEVGKLQRILKKKKIINLKQKNYVKKIHIVGIFEFNSS